MKYKTLGISSTPLNLFMNLNVAIKCFSKIWAFTTGSKYVLQVMLLSMALMELSTLHAHNDDDRVGSDDEVPELFELARDVGISMEEINGLKASLELGAQDITQKNPAAAIQAIPDARFVDGKPVQVLKRAQEKGFI